MNDSIFGITPVLTGVEAATVLRSFSTLWNLNYGQQIGSLTDDLNLCRRFFDPLARGHTLRNRLSSLGSAPPGLAKELGDYKPPLIYDAGDQTFIIGVEGRLLIAMLSEEDLSDAVIVFSASRIAQAEHTALQIYRDWSTARLSQVIDLRNGRGREVMQAIAVGITLALLVNRSDSPDRAVESQGRETEYGADLNEAVFNGAESFATIISGSRRGRSVDEQKLKGGYGITEARRRLAHRIVLAPSVETGTPRVYIPSEFRNDVVTFLARDLARRPSLNTAQLGVAFDALVSALRANAGSLAHKSRTFEMASDTLDLRDELLEAFDEARQ
ncbi:hypothetical protein HH310_27105 [Actinoplanes sp. TBRC 11911]|uniref:hypothetical protein n=1 Tax=Actinoplanes sp. TBRC 11911 TaxID=2729386 RepID=UPI00145CAEDB|nr:hypothetical protein [Actinoplanes sp. TBRC 11911]NMO54839.1 hypothetical protein [Actinoplanes sp. TBRC 11911]